VHGILHRVEGPTLAPEDTEELMRSITSEEHVQHVRERGGADYGFAFAKRRGSVSALSRKKAISPWSPANPQQIADHGANRHPAKRQRTCSTNRADWFLVTGPTGSGKTTTLASMINIINEEREEAHIITVEDPIEYYHKHKKAVVTQREIGVTYRTLRKPCAARCGRTRTWCSSAKCATWKRLKRPSRLPETGHLVFGTLHTTGAQRPSTVSRTLFRPTSRK
jgi:twitching motility protein PilT